MFTGRIPLVVQSFVCSNDYIIDQIHYEHIGEHLFDSVSLAYSASRVHSTHSVDSAGSAGGKDSSDRSRSVDHICN